MQLFAFRDKEPNFGDELNFWLWDRLLPGFFNDRKKDLFLGIGSILYDNFDPAVRKVVFGSGYGGYTNPPTLDDKWKIYFLRGKETAKVLGVSPDLAIGDSAILIRSCWNAADYPKKHDVSFIPHYLSAIRGEWRAVCERAGIHYIDPRDPVEKVLVDTSSSRKIVSEAMHGVIIADALRVPWRAIRPVDASNRRKWFDWASALGVDINFSSIGPSNIVEQAAAMLNWNIKLKNAVVFRQRGIKKATNNHFFGSAVGRLKAAAAEPAQLSSDAAIERAHAEMLRQLERLKADYPAASPQG